MNLRKISAEFDMEMEDPVKMKSIRRTKQISSRSMQDEKDWLYYGLKMSKL